MACRSRWVGLGGRSWRGRSWGLVGKRPLGCGPPALLGGCLQECRAATSQPVGHFFHSCPQTALPAPHVPPPCTAPVPQVFRTYNASITLDRLLAEDSPELTVDGKQAEYNRANKEVGGWGVGGWSGCVGGWLGGWVGG